MPLIYRDFPGAFAAEECDALIALAESSAMEPGAVYGGSDHVPKSFVRNVETSRHPRSSATAWIYDRLDTLFAQAGEALGAPGAPMGEPLQIMRYCEGCHFRAWHTDAGTDLQAGRLLSVSVELSAKADYEGGALEILPDAMGRECALDRGGARIFLSRALHRVTPVTRGVRYSLVNWAPPA